MFLFACAAIVSGTVGLSAGFVASLFRTDACGMGVFERLCWGVVYTVFGTPVVAIFTGFVSLLCGGHIDNTWLAATNALMIGLFGFGLTFGYQFE